VPAVVDFQCRPFQSLNGGRGDGMTLIRWGKGGGAGGASFHLHLSAGGQHMMVFGAVAPAGTVAEGCWGRKG
jgi:hypothetical protein